MPTGLKEYFPMIRSREEILTEIRSKKELLTLFDSWTEEQQKEFLDFCTGVKGIKLLYDAFFKEVMNAEYVPERLDEFLSLLLKRRVHVLCVLPNDSTRIADESSLLITDIVVQLEDGSLANIEVQKIGYWFPGERCACYSADLLLRQYKRVRSEKKKKFSYRDVKTVYTIVFFEKSTKVFHDFPKSYLHYFEQHSDTGLELELLQKYLLIPLDIFQKNYHDKGITNKLDAWLAFFSIDEPEEIIRLIEAYPEFRSMYQEAYQMCRNTEDVMGIFSEELREMDRNTVQLMIDEMQDMIDEQRAALAEQKAAFEQQLKATMEEQKAALAEQKAALAEQLKATMAGQKTEGEVLKLISQIQKKYQKGKSLAAISEELEETQEKIRPLYLLIQAHPDEDREVIYKRLNQ